MFRLLKRQDYIDELSDEALLEYYDQLKHELMSSRRRKNVIRELEKRGLDIIEYV